MNNEIPSKISYAELSDRYGHHLAFDLLLTIEKLAKIKTQVIEMDEEARLKCALAALDKVA